MELRTGTQPDQTVNTGSPTTDVGGIDSPCVHHPIEPGSGRRLRLPWRPASRSEIGDEPARAWRAFRWSGIPWHTERPLLFLRPAPGQKVVGCSVRQVNALSPVRRRLQAFLAPFNPGAEKEFELLVAIGEAMSNAVRYGRGESMRWRACIVDTRVLFELDYGSTPFDTAPRPNDPERMLEGGRGLLLMRKFSDDVQFAFRPGAVHVTIVKRLG